MKNRVNNATKLALSKRWIIVLMAAVFALPAMAGWNTAGINMTPTTPQTTFHSTSTMQGSGSPRSYLPASLNEEGRATYADPYETSASYAPRGPRKSFGQNGEGGITSDESSPIGDAVLPLLLFAAAFGGVITFRRRRAQISPQI